MIESLLQLVCASVASFFRSKESKEIKAELGMDLDMKPEEEEMLMKEFPWIKSTSCGKYAEISETLK
jgi:hypothetical protein